MSATPSVDSSVWQRVRLSEVPAQAWRNGGGLTHELMSQPPGDWRWRISVARIDRDGPFSHFPQVQRHFAVLRGAGVRLEIEGRWHELHAGGAVLAFDGGQTCEAFLIEGPSLDFNLMSRGAAAWLRRWSSSAAVPWQAGQTAGLYACANAQLEDAQGRHWSVEADELLWTAQLPPGPWRLGCSDALVFGLSWEGA
jgi:environmental stress-induced protein Ves